MVTMTERKQHLQHNTGTPSVGVVGGDAYLNWTISNLAYDVVRYIRNPANNASLMAFDKNRLTPTITFDNRTIFTGDLLHGIVSFTLSNVTLSDAWRYSFIVSTGIGIQIFGSQVLIVAEIPNIPGIIPLSLPAVEGQEYKLNCSTESRSVPLDHNLTMYTEWKKNGVNIIMGFGYSVNGTILTISNLDRKDNGSTITCGAFEDQRRISTESSDYILNVLYGPDNVQVTPSDVLTVDEGGSINITCMGECNPPCSFYYWMKDSLPTIVGSFRSYLIPAITRNHAGVYTCIVMNTNISKNATAQITVRVNYPPTVRMESRNGSFSETGLMINCTAHGIPERYIYSLIHSSLFSGIKIRQLIENEPVSTGVLLHWFRNPSFMDTGVYTCIVRNGILDYRDGSLDKNVSETVWIRGPPNVTSNDTDFYADKGHSGRLIIEFYNSLLDASVTWNKQRNQALEKLDNSDKYSVSVASTMVTVKFYSVFIQQPGFTTTLEINNVTEEDFGSYQVTLQNSAGNLSNWTLNLMPRGHPDVPNDVHIVPNSITSSSVDIEWVSGFHGGSDQTFVFEYKIQMDKSWNNYSHDVFGGMKQNKYFNITVEDLHQNTLYFFRLYAWNVFGRSEYSTIVNATTYTVTRKQALSDNGAASVIIGSVLGTCLPIAFIVILVQLYWRRRSCNKGKSSGQSKTCRFATIEGTNMEGYTTINTVASTGGENDKNPYLDLQDTTGETNDSVNMRSSDAVTYDALHPYANSEDHAYSSLNQRPHQKGEEGDYENTKRI